MPGFFKKKKIILDDRWNNPDFESILKRANMRGDNRNAFFIMQCLNSCRNIEGDIIELGVYKGATAYLMAHMIKTVPIPKMLYLFDTFCGSPEPSTEDNPDVFLPYDDCSEKQLERRLMNFISIIRIIPGNIPYSISCSDLDKISFAHIDLALYESTLQGLDVIYERVSTGGIILVEDYGVLRCEGVKKAVDRFLIGNKSSVIYVPTGQGLIFKKE